MIERVPIAAIRIGERRRQDLGDLVSLAKNIEQHGLLHPIVISDELDLIAGERRLRACRSLGMEAIEARRWRVLSESERREIELAENLDRKDLTTAERSRQMAALAETAAAIDREELRSKPERNSGRGRPEKPGSVRRVADRIGVAPATVINAQRHVAALDAYPELSTLSQSAAIEAAAALDAMPEEERAAVRDQDARRSA